MSLSKYSIGLSARQKVMDSAGTLESVGWDLGSASLKHICTVADLKHSYYGKCCYFTAGNKTATVSGHEQTEPKSKVKNEAF